MFVTILMRASSWLYSSGRPRGLTHEDILVALLTRTSSWPYSRGRPHGLTHEDVLVALLTRTSSWLLHEDVLVAFLTRMSSWLLHEDAYNRQTRHLDMDEQREAVRRGPRPAGWHAIPRPS